MGACAAQHLRWTQRMSGTGQAGGWSKQPLTCARLNCSVQVGGQSLRRSSPRRTWWTATGHPTPAGTAQTAVGAGRRHGRCAFACVRARVCAFMFLCVLGCHCMRVCRRGAGGIHTQTEGWGLSTGAPVTASHPWGFPSTNSWQHNIYAAALWRSGSTGVCASSPCVAQLWPLNQAGRRTCAPSTRLGSWLEECVACELLACVQLSLVSLGRLEWC